MKRKPSKLTKLIVSILLIQITTNCKKDNDEIFTERIIKLNKIEICTEAIGNPTNPPILLIMGATASMIWWDNEFVKNLAKRGFYVIRYDNRDTGKSSSFKPGIPPYTILDLVDDSITVIDNYGLQNAHFIGMSMGGMVAQLAAIRYPERVKSLTLISSSIWDNLPDLPPMEQKILDHYSKLPEIDWRDKSQAKNFIVKNWNLLNGSKYRFDSKRAEALAEMEISRSISLQSMFNHSFLAGGEEFYGQSSKINQSVLIFHGTEDPVLPYPHALKMKNSIKNAKLITLKGVGHEIHSADWNLFLEEIERHIRMNN